MLAIETREVIEGRNLLVKEGKKLGETGGVAPVAHQVTGNSKHAHQSHTGTLHAAIGILSQTTIEGTTGLSVGKDFVAFVN